MENERDTHTQRGRGAEWGGRRRDGKGKRKGTAVCVGGGATRERKTETEEMGREQRGEPKGLGEKG